MKKILRQKQKKTHGEEQQQANLWICARATDAAASHPAGAVIRHGAVVAGRDGTEGVVVEADTDR